MSVKQHSCYNDEELCQDIATSNLSVKEMAKKHAVSSSLVYAIAAGTIRPELLVRINELVDAEKAAGMRMAKSRARWFMGRLVQLAALDNETGYKSVVKGLEMAGMLSADGASDKRTIEIVLSSLAGKEPAKNRMTGIVNGNN